MELLQGMRAVVVLVSLATASSVASAQTRETRPLSGFDAIEVGGGIDLDVRQAGEFFVEVETEGELADIITELRDDTLIVRRKSSRGFFGWGDDDAAVHVTLPALTALTASGGSDARTQGNFAGDNLTLVASGGSDLTIAVSAGSLEATASGGSDLRLSGTARSARIRSSGGSDLDASQLTAEDADVQSSGGSDVMIAVRNSIVGSASGGSDVVYSGDPRTVDVDASGGSDVRRR
jgi:hypothetical protein